MGAFPELVGPLDRPVHISSFSQHAVGGISPPALLPAAAAWPLAGMGFFVPFRIAQPFVVLNLWCENGAGIAGTFDIGIYSKSAEKLVSLGSTTQVGASATQKVALGTPLLLPPGTYYMAMSASTVTTATYLRVAPNVASLPITGMAQVASQTPLAQSPTLGSMTNAYIPLFGLGGRSLV